MDSFLNSFKIESFNILKLQKLNGYETYLNIKNNNKSKELKINCFTLTFSFLYFCFNLKQFTFSFFFLLVTLTFSLTFYLNRHILIKLIEDYIELCKLLVKFEDLAKTFLKIKVLEKFMKINLNKILNELNKSMDKNSEKSIFKEEDNNNKIKEDEGNTRIANNAHKSKGKELKELWKEYLNLKNSIFKNIFEEYLKIFFSFSVEDEERFNFKKIKEQQLQEKVKSFINIKFSI